MNILKKLFTRAKKESTDEKTHIFKEIVYTIGWEIYTKDGSVMTRKYKDVSSNDRESTYNSVKIEVSEMYECLNNAHNNKLEFVNLSGNVFRTSDVTKICIINNDDGK